MINFIDKNGRQYELRCRQITHHDIGSSHLSPDEAVIQLLRQLPPAEFISLPMLGDR